MDSYTLLCNPIVLLTRDVEKPKYNKTISGKKRRKKDMI